MTDRPGLFGRLFQGLSKSRKGILGGIRSLFTGRTFGEDLFDELEALLIQADLGIETTLHVIEELRGGARENRIKTADDMIGLLKADLIKILGQGDHSMNWQPDAGGPHVTLVAGVNGSGKTTTIGKLAAHLKAGGHTVLLGAADTFRAAATEQLTIWSQRVGVPIVKHKEGADPAAVAYDAADAAVARKVDCLIIDTAGRLHTKINLMEELKKIQRVIQKRIPSAPHEVLLVLDATTGQNGLQQAKVFTEAIRVTGIVLTKLDGTAKGGMAIAVQKQLGIPIKFIGVGESMEDLQPFNPEEFVQALLGE